MKYLFAGPDTPYPPGSGILQQFNPRFSFFFFFTFIPLEKLHREEYIHVLRRHDRRASSSLGEHLYFLVLDLMQPPTAAGKPRNEELHSEGDFDRYLGTTTFILYCIPRHS